MHINQLENVAAGAWFVLLHFWRGAYGDSSMRVIATLTLASAVDGHPAIGIATSLWYLYPEHIEIWTAMLVCVLLLPSQSRRATCGSMSAIAAALTMTIAAALTIGSAVDDKAADLYPVMFGGGTLLTTIANHPALADPDPDADAAYLLKLNGLFLFTATLGMRFDMPEWQVVFFAYITLSAVVATCRICFDAGQRRRARALARE
jgi:hypothetical protein